MSPTDVKARIYVDAPLQSGAQIDLPSDQIHYLINVLRLGKGAGLAVFNGIDGEFAAMISVAGKRQCVVSIGDRRREHKACPDLWLMFAPVKKARLDFIAQKASELGVRVIWPVNTEFCQIGRVKDTRLAANAIEAAEQTERLDIAEIWPFVPLHEALGQIEDDRLLIWCDEASAGDPSLNVTVALGHAPPHEKAAILIGPEGGFSAAEREILDGRINCLKISLGPRILRADTAAISALSCYQSVCGDWRGEPV
jgi:16S rRNA (uracil1498-N3)-methyltransferase